MAQRIAECLVCEGPLTPPLEAADFVRLPVNCANCGTHRYDGSAMTYLLGPRDTDPLTRARQAYAVRRVPKATLLTAELLRHAEEVSRLPMADEQIDNFVLHVAGTTRPGQQVDCRTQDMRAVIGAVEPAEARWVMRQAIALGLMAPGLATDSSIRGTSLTAAGWQRHTELMRNGARSRHAFMAMKFGDAQLMALYRDHLRPAAEQTGFDLRATFEDHKTAGSIDNRMRVEIRTSRFLVCDLTHGNRGAYWEAGFAEGLGRPVFYICRADVLDNKNHPDHPHFDTAHQLIIAWDPTDPAAGMRELKAVIRATLPAEARMEDL
ncbi:MAG: hypothetical protein ABI574_13900 [Burkholderiales bacterium]